MALPVITNVYRCAFKWNNPTYGLNAVNVMHFKKAGSTAAALAAALNTNATNTMWEHTSTSSKITEIDITPLDAGTVTLQYAVGTPANWTGHGGAGDVIPQSCAVIKLLTGKRGRAYRGRVFLPWLAEGQSDNGKILGSLQTTLNGAWLAFHTAMTAAGWDFVVASYRYQTAEDVVTAAAETWTATQKRRLIRTAAI